MNLEKIEITKIEMIIEVTTRIRTKAERTKAKTIIRKTRSRQKTTKTPTNQTRLKTKKTTTTTKLGKTKTKYTEKTETNPYKPQASNLPKNIRQIWKNFADGSKKKPT